MTDRFDELFWLAVAVLALRVLQDLLRACRRIGWLAVRGLVSLPDFLETSRARPHATAAPCAVSSPSGPRTNYLETLSAEEMDEFLS